MSKLSQWQSLSQSPNPGQNNGQQSQQSQQAPLSQSPQLQSQNQPQPPINTSPLANYTLPGVISYLTNEFTNLERFKIMTNLEKSEMKSRITQLQGELNALKLANEQQKIKIESLEKENASLRQGNGIPPREKEETTLPQIPEVDLQVIKDSRYQLTKSMKEVIHLLRSPVNSNLSYLELPNIQDSNVSFDELFQKEDFIFSGYNKADKSHDKDNRSVVNTFFNNGNDSDDIQINDSAINEKFADMNISDSNGGLESDTETVILDGTQDLKEQHDGEIEPDTEFTKSPNVPAPDMEDIHPSPKIIETSLSLETPGFNSVKVFNNPVSDTLVYIHYDNPDSPDAIQVSLFEVATNTVLADVASSKSLFDDVSQVVDLFCTSFEAETQKIRLLSVRREGAVTEIVLDGDDSMTSSVVNLAARSMNITGSGLIEFDHKSTDTSKSFGLAVSLASKTNTLLKVYDITIGSRNSVSSTEIGSYVLNFFKIKDISGNSKFEVLKWFKADINKESHTKSPKAHKRSGSSPDTSLSPFQLLLRLGTCIFHFNIVSKSYSVITDYSSKYVPDLEGNDSNVVVAHPPDITIYELNNQTKSGPASKKYKIPEDQSQTSRFCGIGHGSSYYVVAVSEDAVKVYDDALSLISTCATGLAEPPEKVYRVGKSIAVQNSDYLKIFSLF